ncbi:Ig-like domain-containing protein [Mucilaginibacter mali]|uniref:Ig-like domain-containing protein n=1 Tax=Mucilaginibacter mali TaxID=2740462 RepID=A0A7D4Q3M3_9SPHI|nr:Ig-like domain-containing protein [Mucilaginibacter mali]
MKISLFILIIFGFLLTTACQKASTQVVLQTIKFQSETLNRAVGDNLQLTPIFTPSVFSSIDVVWSTSNDAVLTIQPDHTIHANKAGSAWITVKDKNSATAGKCLIIVN